MSLPPGYVNGRWPTYLLSWQSYPANDGAPAAHERSSRLRSNTSVSMARASSTSDLASTWTNVPGFGSLSCFIDPGLLAVGKFPSGEVIPIQVVNPLLVLQPITGREVGKAERKDGNWSAVAAWPLLPWGHLLNPHC